jgi:N-acetylmuramoyl-L-alanine amidase
MTHALSRRRLLQASLAGLPLLAACSDDSRAPASGENHAASVAGEATVAPSSAPAAVESPAATPVPAAQAEPVPAGPKVRTIVLDPGHGAEEIGAASAIAGLPSLTEKDSNLAMSWRLRELLEGDGFRVLMTRESDSRAIGFVPPASPSPGPGGMSVGRADLQARVDRSNSNNADLFLSVHSNDSGSLAENGVEVWYCAEREVGDLNGLWAQVVLENVLASLADYGYRANNRGTKEDHFFRVRNDQNFHIFVLGPPKPESGHPRATMAPAALVENLFMRHERDIRVLRDPTAREYIAQGMRRAVNRWFEFRGG